MADPDWKWHGLYRCARCADFGRRVRATIRIFSGVGGYHGGGYPVCDEHAPITIELVLHGMLKIRYQSNAAEWIVRAYAVTEDEDGYPKLDRELFNARLRTTVLQGVPAHATQDPELPPGPKV